MKWSLTMISKLLFISLVSLCLSSCLDTTTVEDDDVGQASYAITGEGHAWQHGDWTARILYEARYALNADADGYSNIESGSGASKKWYSDWNYVTSDSYAFTQASSEASNIVGTVTPALWVPSLGTSVYRGGWCTFFVRLVMYRATYWAFDDHYTTPNYPNSSVYTITPAMTKNYASMQPGWVFLSPASTHYAIAEKRETIGGVAGWWMIDSNYVCSYCIGKHFMSDATLSNQGYYGWKPDRGTNDI
jgi:hypothetical protein